MKKRLFCLVGLLGLHSLFVSCSHEMMVDMQREQAKHDYLTGSHDRQSYESQLQYIEAQSNEWKTSQSVADQEKPLKGLKADDRGE